MRMGFYPRLAADGIRKNKRMYVPYILTCLGMVMMFYIIMFLSVSDTLTNISGGEVVREIFALGSWVIAVFAAIFLFYTNSFLIRRREREFGLYNVLGMGKGSIGRILVWETLMIAAIAISAGLLAGIAVSKLAELGFVDIMRGDVTYDFTVSGLAVKRTVQVFLAIFALLLLNDLRKVGFSSAVTLMNSESAGERPPRGNIFLGLAGAVLLAAAYYIAVTITDPLSALVWFFAAVIMVIIGSYLLMIAGSVTLCRLLQRRKRYYYNPRHFVSVASMVYRMRRNGAGLASICILATMVLVMISSTTCLYFGEERAIAMRYPREIAVYATPREENGSSAGLLEPVRRAVRDIAGSHGAKMENVCDFRYLNVTGALMADGTVETDPDLVNSPASALENLYNFCFVPLEDYNAMTGESLTLEEGQALIFPYRGDYTAETIAFRRGPELRVAGRVEDFTGMGSAAMDITSTVFVFVPDLDRTLEAIFGASTDRTDRYFVIRWIIQFDTGLDAQGQKELYRELYERLRSGERRIDFPGVGINSVECREAERDDFYGLYGSLFYIGIILSIVFIIAAVLIIYYKQISEGYEDRARFEIMRKVGMTRREIRRSVNSQLLTVFFLPLAFAAMHVAFAFPIINKLLILFSLRNVALFAKTTALSVGVFALFYTAVYKSTSNAYYNIVAEERE